MLTCLKGNLKHLDYGKNNYTFYNRTNQKAINLTMKLSSFGDRDLSREERIEKLMTLNPEDIFDIEEVDFNPPAMAEIHQSVICDNCGNPTMGTRIKKIENKNYCIPCYEEVKK